MIGEWLWGNCNFGANGKDGEAPQSDNCARRDRVVTASTGAGGAMNASGDRGPGRQGSLNGVGPCR